MDCGLGVIIGGFVRKKKEARKFTTEFDDCFLDASEVFAVKTMDFGVELLVWFLGDPELFALRVDGVVSTSRSKVEDLDVSLFGLTSGEGVPCKRLRPHESM